MIVFVWFLPVVRILATWALHFCLHVFSVFVVVVAVLVGWGPVGFLFFAMVFFSFSFWAVCMANFDSDSRVHVNCVRLSSTMMTMYAQCADRMMNHSCHHYHDGTGHGYSMVSMPIDVLDLV